MKAARDVTPREIHGHWTRCVERSPSPLLLLLLEIHRSYRTFEDKWLTRYVHLSLCGDVTSSRLIVFRLAQPQQQ